MVVARRAAAGGKKGAAAAVAAGQGKKSSSSARSLPLSVESANPQSICITASSLPAAAAAAAAAVDVSSPLELGASVECATTDQPQPTIMLGK